MPTKPDDVEEEEVVSEDEESDEYDIEARMSLGSAHKLINGAVR